MSENDKESKTEQASDKKIRDAQDNGNLPQSQELGILGSVVGIFVAAMLLAGDATDALKSRLALMLQKSALIKDFSGGDASNYLANEVTSVFFVCVPLLMVILIGSILGPMSQNPPQANLERVRPKLQKLSPGANFKRIFSKQSAFDFLKMVLKVLAVSSIAYWAMQRNLPAVLRSSSYDVAAIPNLILQLSRSMLGPLCFVALIISVIDLIFTRLRWFNDLKMTRQEVKDEHKQSDGDPLMKERIRMIGRQRIKAMMMNDLPKATFVVVNPTHFAVAMRYVPSEGGAPIVIAKGVDHLALRIRGFCEENDIAVVENVALARSLYSTTEIGEMIPPEFYRAIAEIIHFVERRKPKPMQFQTQG